MNGPAKLSGQVRESLLLSVDFEDWHQLVRRAAGASDWDTAEDALRRQTAVLLDRLDSLGATATFFFLGVTARRYPELVGEIVARGHEPACHGFAHERVYRQTRAEFEQDVGAAAELIEALCGRRPVCYRAPAFSITRDTPWAFEVLAGLGFRFDSSLHDSPRIPDRIRGIPDAPCRIDLPSGAELWEVPVCVARVGGRAVPIGGGSYWRLLPAAAIIAGLHRAHTVNRHPVIYIHPYEVDPHPLRARLSDDPSWRARAYATQRSLWRNTGRRRFAKRLTVVGSRFQLMAYEQAYADIIDHTPRSRALSREGVLV